MVIPVAAAESVSCKTVTREKIVESGATSKAENLSLKSKAAVQIDYAIGQKLSNDGLKGVTTVGKVVVRLCTQ